MEIAEARKLLCPLASFKQIYIITGVDFKQPAYSQHIDKTDFEQYLFKLTLIT